MNVLVVNAGSSSVELSVVTGTDEVADHRRVESWDGASSEAIEQAIHAALATGTTMDAVAHRFVHGGPDLVAPTVVSADVERRLREVSSLAPLHQPRALVALGAAREVVSGLSHVACFDTAFHATLPAAAATYALPQEWRHRWPLRRFGFHGWSHAHVARRAPRVVGRPEGCRVVSAHIGSGVSLCAITGGASVDTTMGFTPLEGPVMATRSGTIDPGLVLWLLSEGGLSVGDVADGLRSRSGLAGLTGGSGDLRDLAGAVDDGDLDAELALEVYVLHLRRAVGAMAASLGGLDVLAFTGGVGRHQPRVRAGVAAGLEHLGVEVDNSANDAATDDAAIHRAGGPVGVAVVSTGEHLEMARAVRHLLQPSVNRA